jgi:hypothetical protein
MHIAAFPIVEFCTLWLSSAIDFWLGLVEENDTVTVNGRLTLHV